MSTVSRRITVTLSPELEEALELLKKVFYRENESVIARMLMEHGMDALYGRRDTGIVARIGVLCFAGEHGRIYAREECRSLSLVGEYVFPNVRIKITDISETRTETITHAKVIREAANCVEETDGILTADGILYVYTQEGYEMYPVGGRYVRGRRPVKLDGRTYIPVLLKRSIQVEEVDGAEVVNGFSDGGDIEYYFCAQDGELYRYDRKGTRLVCQRVLKK